MLSSSSFTRSQRGKWIFLAVNRAWGLASALSLIVYASQRFPRPLKRSGYLRSTISFWLSMDPSSIVSTLATMLSAVIAGRPKNWIVHEFFCQWTVPELGGIAVKGHIVTSWQRSECVLTDDGCFCPCVYFKVNTFILKCKLCHCWPPVWKHVQKYTV